MSDMDMPALKSAINHHLDVGRKILTLGELAHAIREDEALALIKLREWQSKGWVKILKKPIDAQPDEECVEAISYIDGERPWSDPLSGKM